MKIRMITFHTPKNYGAVLQAFSLMSYLKTLSDDVKVIDFNTPHLKSIYPLVDKPHSLKQLAKCILDMRFLSKKKCKFQKFEEFVKTKLDLTERYESFEKLASNPPVADYYFTGSDQVFNPNRVLDEKKAFYLNFGNESIKRVSYAGSFGVKSIDTGRQEEIADLLEKINFISVRETSGVEIVKALIDRDVDEVLDPVFLNDGEFWSEQSQPYKQEFSNYLFYYRLMHSPVSDAAARRMAKEKGLKLIVMTDNSLKWKADKVLRDVGPKEFLYLMKKADYVATDSFHGAAFSLLFKKQFAFTDCNPKLAERALNLLEKAGAGEAAIINGNQGGVVVDYNAVDKKLASMISQSKCFIKNTFEKN